MAADLRRVFAHTSTTTHVLTKPHNSLDTLEHTHTAMALAFESPVLQVDANVIHKVDTSNPQNLHRMWTVFQKCADSVAHGRRLENLSWRLWQREMFCVEPTDIDATAFSSSTSAPMDIQQSARPSAEDVPQLSGSVDSVVDDEAVELSSESAPVEIIRPAVRRQDSLTSSRSRGRERHITSGHLEKMVVSIVHHEEPLTAPLPKIASPIETTSESAMKELDTPFLTRSGSTSTEQSPSQSSDLSSSHPQSSPESSEPRGRTTVVRGFSPASVSINHTLPSITKTSSDDSIPQPDAAPAAKHVQPKKQPAKFALGGSSSCEESSLSDPRSLQKAMSPVQRRKMMKAALSSEDSGSLKRTASRNATLLSALKRQPASSAQLVVHANSAIDEDQSETEADYVDESAIDDEDDSSDWEDSIEDSGRSSMDDRGLFQRVDSKANLTSRPSLITLMLAKNDQAQRYSNIASQSTSALPRMSRSMMYQQPLVASPNESDDAPLTMKTKSRAPPMRPINEVPRSVAQPIVATANIQVQGGSSPRTTRRHMLSSELTESLRRNLLWERQQKTSTANAVLKRRHTSQDIANLRQYPEKVHMKKDNTDVNASSWDADLDRDSFKVW